ncbi:SLATT domain-containing protein [Clostridium botulinum]|uniref:SMODS and SLOG-associating 2TM effector domain-containing protein n=1 Tax=Clostridium botulinum (strain Langeland / NCTC 10281 / Type F) TaxID=441772 RepID=A7GBJ7_CLOBL|nr:SLATT domain-containing protein [Clostridium botulinum]ABS40761.1 hypothetical protein CLI_0885 [Clostridium botulinum F str. Langeland]ADF98625.1 hypothetical protein CBF_0856 [Clostridium botulinum F str. 230613]KKM40092.1 hypothetical protein VT72_17505 [Clostridium botulinum]MBY6791890.1 SLATT domain-containing protein [Clostridium botulinum]MBY6935898.1 SLATT domain-containing protein [Clostridium botulinum]
MEAKLNRIIEADKNDVNKGKKLLEELRRRVDITYRTRIISADRLRNKNKEYKKLNMYYSALVTALSILSIGKDYKFLGVLSVSNIVLMFSILLSYYMFYTSEKNLQERAYKMEETFKDLDRLKNKIDIILSYYQEIEENKCKRLYQEYERILTSIENHEQMDFYIYKLNLYNKQGIKDSDKLVYKEIKLKVKMYKITKTALIIAKYVIPTVIAGMLFWGITSS